MRSWVLRFLVGLPVLIAVVLPAHATVMVALDLPTLVREADVVVVADVVGQTARWDAHRRIVTDVELAVVEPMKGTSRPGDVVVLTRLGGAIGELGMRIEGEPLFADGERVLVFARTSTEDHVSLCAVGMSQGVMPVEHGQVLPGGGGLALVQQGSDGHLRPSPPALAGPRALTAIRDDIRTLLAGGR